VKRTRKSASHTWSYGELIITTQQHFIEYGYKSTHLDDISMAAEIPKGTIYRYAQSKEALFWLALRWADSPYAAKPHKNRPVPAPPKRSIQRYVLRRLGRVRVAPQLDEGPPAHTLEQARVEFRAALAESYKRLFENRTAIRLIQKCSHEHPALEDLFLEPRRKPAVDQLTRFLEVHQEYLRPGIPPSIVARVSFATIAFMAMYRKWSPEEIMYRHPRWIRDTVLDMLPAGVLQPALPPASDPDEEDELDVFDPEYARQQEEELERSLPGSLLQWLCRPYPDQWDLPLGWDEEDEEGPAGPDI